MASLISNARVNLTMAALTVLLSYSAKAADMPFLPPAPDADAQMEFGTGWYLRGDIGAAKATRLNMDGASMSPSFPNNWTGGLGFGYQYNSSFRTDVTVDYESLYNVSGANANNAVLCQIGAAPVKNLAGLITGSTPVVTTCVPNSQSRVETMAVMANAYVDLGTWYGFTPYVGGGIGVDVMYKKAQVNWLQGNGVPYAGVTWTDPFLNATFMANMDSKRVGTQLKFAYALMGGVAYDVTDRVKIDVGYRWLNLGKVSGSSFSGATVTKNVVSNQVRVGVRYTID